MRTTRVSLLLLLGLISGCHSSTAPEPEILVGHWITEPKGLSPSGSMQYHLVLQSDGQFSLEVRTYGLYPEQADGELSAFSRHEGVFQARGAHIGFKPHTLVWWDRFYGSAAPTVQRPSPYHSLYDQATFETQDGFLTLHYITYPADAPVPTQQTYRRATQ